MVVAYANGNDRDHHWDEAVEKYGGGQRSRMVLSRHLDKVWREGGRLKVMLRLWNVERFRGGRTPLMIDMVL